LALSFAGPTVAQEPPAAAPLLSDLAGLWQYVVRAADGTEGERGFRTFISLSPDTLVWIDESSDGARAEGQLRFVASLDQYEYAFPGQTGICFVRGRLSGSSSIRFGRDGSCYDEVLESVLTVHDRDAFSLTYANGALAVDFMRRPR
jgi:hypothetical protein